MNKNTLIGFALMALVLFGYSILQQPSSEQIEAQRIQDSLIQAKKSEAKAEQENAEATYKAKALQAMAEDSTALFYTSFKGKEQHIVLKNDKIELSLSTLGAAPKKAKLLHFENINKEEGITLFEGNEQELNFLLAGKTTNISTAQMYFEPSEVTDSTVTFTATASNGGSVVLKYVLGKDYLVHLSLQVNALSGMFAPDYREMGIEWREHCRQQERGFMFENRYATLTYKEKDGSTDYLSESSSTIDEAIENRLDWVAFKNQFFSAVLISKDDFSAQALLSSIPEEKPKEDVGKNGVTYLKQYQAKLKTAFDPTGQKASEFELYIGPNDFRLLQDVEEQSTFNKDLELQQLVYLGWPLFRIINRWFTLYVFDWLTGFGFNMGIVLIIITLLLKAITYPLVKKTYLNSAKMRVLKPKIEEATKEYNKPEDQMMKQQAMMRMYSQYGVSPLSGCLPMLIQMPIWIAMFNFVPNAIQLRGQSFLWIDDLSTYDPIIEWNTQIWLIGDHPRLTCILFCISNILYSIITMRQQKDQMVGQQAEQLKMMQWMMYLMPLMFFFMFNDYSSGLNFYYFISLFFSAAIMWLLRKTTNDKKLLEILEAKYKENKNNPKKMSGLAARLEAMQKEAEELRKRREGMNK